QTDPDLSLKMAVADGLGEVGDRKAVAILVHLYYHGEMLDRRFIINALSSATDPSAVVVLSDAFKQSYDPSLRVAALTGLGNAGTVAYLKSAIRDQDQITRRHAAELFDNIDFGAGHPILVAALSSPDSEVQLAAVKTLGIAGGDPEVELLGSLLRNSRDPITR